MARGPVDHVRHHRARAEIHTERDKLLKRADRNVDIQKFMPNDGKDRARAMLLASGLVVCSMAGYVIMLLMWFYVYHESLMNTIVAFVLLICLSVALCLASSKNALGKDRPWLWWLGLLHGQATLVALVIGFFLYFRFLCYYWKYMEMRTYTNVAAAQHSAAFSDGSMFLFTEDTRLDPVRSVGFKSRWTGQTYCVAPIVDSSMNNGNDIHYWAIGMDCCNARAGFRCDDAEDFSTRSALVVLEPEDVVRPFMRWAVRGASYPHYKQAVALQEATYFTKAALKPKLVFWSKDPLAMREAYYTTARSLCLYVSVAYVLLASGFTYWISWRLIPKQRREGVIRQTA
mmetsp:Transcript_100673/g.324834  ORF Transcript_100673/g.324834 Transcript_100673/m.324834 type:complete len:344 (+) Transcript_100673:146-1177(+)